MRGGFAKWEACIGAHVATSCENWRSLLLESCGYTVSQTTTTEFFSYWESRPFLVGGSSPLAPSQIRAWILFEIFATLNNFKQEIKHITKLIRSSDWLIWTSMVQIIMFNNNLLRQVFAGQQPQWHKLLMDRYGVSWLVYVTQDIIA